MELKVETYIQCLTEQNITHLEAFWKKSLKGFTAPTSLPVDRAFLKNELIKAEYQEQAIHLPKTLASALDLTKKHNLTINTLFQGAWALLLNRYSREEDLVFGIQVFSANAGSDIVSLSDPLPIRIQVNPDTPILSWLQELQTQWITLQAYKHTPLAKIQEWSDVSVGTPLFESLLVLTDAPIAANTKAQGSQVDNHLDVTLYPLTVVGYLTLDKLQINYNHHRFDEATITRMLGHLQTLLAGMAANPEQRLADLPLLTAAEHHQLVEWNKTQVDYPRDKCIHQLFEEQVERSPEAIALVMPSIGQGADQQLTYRELNSRSNQLAYHLKNLGVEPSTFVAMSMERSIEMIVAMLAILKVGGVYVPLDPAYPQERLVFMLEDTNAPVLLTQSHLVERLPAYQAQILCLDANWGADTQLDAVPLECNANSSSLAYVNYTSGSTGRPKGVAIPHRGVLRLVFGSSYTQLDANQTILQLAPISFDAATFEIWGALLHGARCVLFPGNGIPDPKDLGTIIRNNQISTLWLTAALFNTIIAEAPEALMGVRELLTGGEALSIAHIRQALELLPETQLINGYGPTESTTFTCCYRIPRQLEANLTSIPIGKPIANTEVYILDPQLQPVPIGVTGELYIGGDGLAREYLNLPEQTKERFIPHPFR